MKKTVEILKKVLVCFLILLVLNNFCIGNISPIFVYASENTTGQTSNSESNPLDILKDALNVLLGTVVGLLTWPLRIVALAVGYGVSSLMGLVAFIENPTGENNAFRQLTIPDILFNRVSLLNINFFKVDESGTDSLLYKFRTGISFWYYAMRNIAAAILLCILIYVGIRMALSTVSAQQKASYKKMLVDWVVSLAIIFILQYVILFTVYVNDAIVNAIEGVSESLGGDKLTDFMTTLAGDALKVDVDSIAATVVYCMLVFQTFGLFISYFNRMLKLAFLIIISPLITLTYSIDKMGDGKAQALNTWLKEYVFTILIQPFHCIIYMVFVSTAINFFDNGMKNSLAASVLAILCINFIKEAEKIVRKIFAFADDSEHTSLAAGMAVAAVAASKGKSIGKTTRKAITGAKDLGIRAKNALSTGKVEAIAAARMLTGGAEGKSFEDVKSEVRTEQYNKKAEKEENKRYGTKQDQSTAEIEARAKKFMENGMNKSEAMARARLEIAKEKRKATKADEKGKKFARNHPRIASARGGINKVRRVLQQSETLKELGGFAKASVAAGVGVAFGAGVYGSSGSFSQGVLTGAGAYSGTQEFMKSSTNTLKTDIHQRLQSLGIAGKTEAIGKMNELAINGSKYENNDEIDKILEELKTMLENANIDPKLRTNIRNTIQKSIAQNPSADIGSIVSGALAANGINPANMDAEKFKGISDATTKLANFTQEKGIYDTMKQAGDIGLSPDAFIYSVARSYAGSPNASSETTSGSTRTSDLEFLDQAVAITAGQDGREDRFVAPSDDSAREFFESRNDADLRAFYKECDREIDRATQEIEREANEKAKADLIAKLNQLVAAKTKIQDLEFDRAVDRIRKEYQDTLDKIISAKSGEAQMLVDGKLTMLQQDYDRYVKEAKEQLKRGEMEGVKNHTQLVAQRMQLDKDLSEIQSIRERYSRSSGGGTH